MLFRSLELSEPLNNSYYNIEDGVLFKWRSSSDSVRLNVGTNNPPSNILNGLPVGGNEYFLRDILDPTKTYYWQIDSDFGKSAIYFFNPCLIQGEVRINEFMAINGWTSYDPIYSESSDWIEITNESDYPILLSDYYLGDNKRIWALPGDSVILPGAYMLFWADGRDFKNHTNFKLRDKGESIFLLHEKDTIQKVTYSEQFQDVSCALIQDRFHYFHSPTPLRENDHSYTELRTEVVSTNYPSGFYDAPIKVDFKEKNRSIFYTTDGSNPTLKSRKFSTPIEISKTTVLKYIIQSGDSLPSEVVTNTYFINNLFTLPVISLSTDPKFLDDKKIGIFQNVQEDWERTANLEYFDFRGKRVVNQNIGIKLNGWGIRSYPMKPLSIFARGKYGKSKIEYPFFENIDCESYSTLIFRNGGNDITSTKIRDGLMQTLVNEIDIDQQGFQPAIIYWNGSYYGIVNIREKINEDYLNTHHGVNQNKIDMIEPVLRGDRYQKVIGDSAVHDYNLMESYLKDKNLNNEEVFKYVASKMDVHEYINYMISEIYFANLDWIGNNVKIWKSREETLNDKWRWILFDTDFGFGLYDYSDYDQNLLESAATPNGTEWPNPPFSTFLFRKLLENDSFRKEFSQRFMVYLNTIFEPNKVINVIDSLQAIYAPEMPNQVYRWGAVKTIENWKNQVNKLREFARLRPEYCIKHLQNKFNYSDVVYVNFESSIGGNILIAGGDVFLNQYNGSLFKNCNVQIQAKAKEGFVFDHWEGVDEEFKNDITIDLLIKNNQMQLKAVFTKK